jgi:hypothetical protein
MLCLIKILILNELMIKKILEIYPKSTDVLWGWKYIKIDYQNFRKHKSRLSCNTKKLSY